MGVWERTQVSEWLGSPHTVQTLLGYNPGIQAPISTTKPSLPSKSLKRTWVTRLPSTRIQPRQPLLHTPHPSGTETKPRSLGPPRTHGPRGSSSAGGSRGSARSSSRCGGSTGTSTHPVPAPVPVHPVPLTPQTANLEGTWGGGRSVTLQRPNPEPTAARPPQCSRGAGGKTGTEAPGFALYSPPHRQPCLSVFSLLVGRAEVRVKGGAGG